MKRMKKTVWFAAALLPMCLCAAVPVGLKTEFLENPLALDTAQPRFSWIVEDSTPGAKQTAYRVQAASSPEFKEPLLWDSGKVVSDQSHLVSYSGNPLTSRQQVWWRVKSWGKDGAESGWSRPAQFGISLLNPEDWKAQWIMAPRFQPVESPATDLWLRRTVIPTETVIQLAKVDAAARRELEKEWFTALGGFRPAPLFRKTFNLPAKPDAARLYVCGLGICEVTINGRRIDDTLFSPAESHYPEYVHYQALDVAPFLKAGENVIGVLLGNGRFFENLTFNRAAYGEDLPLIAQLEVQTGQGPVTVVTDGSWRCAPSPVLKNHFWLSECYDATREMAGWDAPGFDDSSWQSAQLAKVPTRRLVAQTLPPERIVRRVRPVAVTQPRPGIWVFDMGELIVGCAELRLNAPSGTAVSLRYGEQVFRPVEKYDPPVHGSLLRYDDFKMTGPEPGMLSCKQRGNGFHVEADLGGKKVKYHGLVPADVYVAKGGGETWHTRFAYHPFRYVELIGFPGTPTADTITGLVVHTALERRGTFDSSDPMLNRIHEAAVHSADYCTHGLVNDNTGAEKQNGLTPAIAQGKGAVFFRDEAPLWDKVMADLRAVTPESMVPKMLGSGTRHPRGWASVSTIWSRQGVELPWYYSLHFGDSDKMAGFYPFMTAYVDFYTRKFEKDGKLPGDEFGDHMAADTAYGKPAPVCKPDGTPDRSVPEVNYLTPTDLTGAAYVIGMTRTVAEAAALLGKAEDAKRFAGLADRLTEKFNAVYFRPDLSAYGYPAPRPVYSVQGGNALALYFGLVPDDKRAAVLDALVKDIGAWGGIATGMAATVPLLDVLAANEHVDLALKVLTQTNYPGPGHSLTFGTQTLPEIWARPDGPSRGSLVQSEYVWLARWFYTVLGGIHPDPAAPGFKHFFLEPALPAALTSVRCSTVTPYGEIVSAWKREGDAIRWSITVPWNTIATVKLPAAKNITVNGEPVKETEFELSAGKWEVVTKE